MQSIICRRCGQAFGCGHVPGSCWCNDLSALAGECQSIGCVCPDCLLQEARQGIGEWLGSHAVGVAVPVRLRGTGLMEGIDYYLEHGNWVFTEWYHRKRGRCCGNGCRHCPWRSAGQGS